MGTARAKVKPQAKPDTPAASPKAAASRRQSEPGMPGSPGAFAMTQKLRGTKPSKTNDSGESCLAASEAASDSPGGSRSYASLDAVWAGPGTWEPPPALGGGSTSRASQEGRRKSVDDADLDTDTTDPALVEKQARADQLREALKASSAALTKADWKDCKDEISGIIETAAKELKHAEQTVEKAAVSVKHSQLDLPTSRKFTSIAESHLDDVRNQIERVRAAKTTLCESRNKYTRETQHRHNKYVLSFEDKVVPAFSNLCQEAESAFEISHALKRGVSRVPISTLAGTWRRSLLASLTIIDHIWESLNVGPDVRDRFVVSLLDALQRAPGANKVEFEDALQLRKASNVTLRTER